mmetsp:Transcript_35086/g.70919  ORF Transcript_35086/g.70919 Transcript_35086/m.70919 type:complete len:105 (+) Transcript_35086:92-406(+)
MAPWNSSAARLRALERRVRAMEEGGRESEARIAKSGDEQVSLKEYVDQKMGQKNCIPYTASESISAVCPSREGPTPERIVCMAAGRERGTAPRAGAHAGPRELR